MKYYRAEDKRHRRWLKRTLDFKAATVLAFRMGQAFGHCIIADLGEPGSGCEARLDRDITLDPEMLNVLNVAHEVAHVVEFGLCNFHPTRPYPKGWRTHGTRHRLIVDLLLQHAKQQGWIK